MSAPTITAPATAGGGVPVGGSGAAGYVAKWTAPTTLGGSTTTGADASLYVDATGNVGIGTASPSAQLHISRAGGTSNAEYIRLTNTTVATNSACGITFFQNNAAVPVNRIEGTVSAAGSYDLVSYAWNGASTAEVMRLQGSTGNVGIGTTSPAAKLDVAYGDYLTTGAVRIGADVGTNTSRTNATGKVGAISVPHFTNAAANAFLIGAYANTASTTTTYIGGGLGNMNASTRVSIYAGATSTTSPGTEIVAVTTAGLFLGSTAALVFNAAGTNQGLKLYTTPGNTDPNTLDCYEEGTWTPTLAGFVTNTPGTITASYTRVGRMVTLNVYLYAGGSLFGSTLGTTTVTVPSGMTPNFNGVGHGGLSRTTSSVAQVIAYYDGKIYLGTSVSAVTEMWVSVTYFV